MARILHLCGLFDPAADVVRVVQELRRVSKHTHSLVVRSPHPKQDIFQFQEPEQYFLAKPDYLFEKADAVLCHFIGWPFEWGKVPDLPMAFRNLNIRYSHTREKFWSETQYTARNLKAFKLVSSSHLGGMDIVGREKFRWLPDLIPIWEEAYTPDFSPRAHRVSFIKHADQLRGAEFDMPTLDVSETAHKDVLRRRKHEATIVIDNVCDGHWGLAGMEALSLGLPVMVWNHPITASGLKWLMLSKNNGQNPLHPLDNPCLPFDQVSSFGEIVEHVKSLASWSDTQFNALRRDLRIWTERHFASENLVQRIWDPFFDELLAKP